MVPQDFMCNTEVTKQQHERLRIFCSSHGTFAALILQEFYLKENELVSAARVKERCWLDFHVLASEVNGLNNIAISTFLHCLLLACRVLTQTKYKCC